MAGEAKLILIAGGAGPIGRPLARRIGQGKMLGNDKLVRLHMLDIAPENEALERFGTGLMAASFPLLEGVVATTNVADACQGVDIAVMVVKHLGRGGNNINDANKQAEMAMYRSLCSNLQELAAPNYKILVVDCPEVTNALVLRGILPITNPRNMACLAGPVDARNAEFAAAAACDSVRDWVHGTPEDAWVMMGVFSDGSYNAPAECMYPLPVTCENGEWIIAQGIVLDLYPVEEFWKNTLEALTSLMG